METLLKSHNFVFCTENVCPPEIHFTLEAMPDSPDDTVWENARIKDIKFVGGGCPGNAQLVERFIKNQSVLDVLPILKDIDCRDNTSCPHQLSQAFVQALNGDLSPKLSFRVETLDHPVKRLGIIGAVNGDTDQLQRLLEKLEEEHLDAILCMGNLTGEDSLEPKFRRLFKKPDLLPVVGERDWQHILDPADSTMDAKTCDWLLQQAQVQVMPTTTGKIMAFYGEYLQTLDGYSDFEPYAIEINMTAGLAQFMQDEAVFPALEAMTPQFQTDVICFGQTGQWNHWKVADKLFISVGDYAHTDPLSWGLLEDTGDGFCFNTMIL